MELVNCFLFADDAKLCKHIRTLSDRDELQKAFHMLTSWSERWMLKLYLTKCRILSVKRQDPILYDYYVGNGSGISEDSCDYKSDNNGVTIKQNPRVTKLRSSALPPSMIKRDKRVRLSAVFQQKSRGHSCINIGRH